MKKGSPFENKRTEDTAKTVSALSDSPRLAIALLVTCSAQAVIKMEHMRGYAGT
jgi:hypothetical protein